MTPFSFGRNARGRSNSALLTSSTMTLTAPLALFTILCDRLFVLLVRLFVFVRLSVFVRLLVFVRLVFFTRLFAFVRFFLFLRRFLLVRTED